MIDLLPGEGTIADVAAGAARWAVVTGDCLAVLPTLPAGAVDAVVTDPPYSEATHSGARSGAWDTSITMPLRSAFSPISISDLRRALALCAPRRWCVATVDWHHVHALESCPPAGLRFVRFGVWVKPNGMPQMTGDRPSMGWEAVALLHGPDRMRWARGGGHAVWRCLTARSGVFAAGNHPTEKPIELGAMFTLDFTDPDDLIVDPFAGSGTTGVAALRTGRRFIGIEIAPEYAAVARKRCAEAFAQPRLFDDVPAPRPAQSALELSP